MNKLMLVATLMLITSVSIAQNLSIGPTAGFGHSWNNAETNAADKLFHPSYNIGGKLVYSFDSRWGVSADVKFSGEGATIGTDADNKVVSRLNYLRVPLQGIYFFGKFGDKIRPKISLGPSFGFLVGGKTKTFQNGEKSVEIKSSDIYTGVDFGATVAGGLNVRIAPYTWLNADLSYYLGLSNVAETGDIKNRNIGINIGVTFPLATLRPEKITRENIK
ncbi:MAG: PorT family protein [Chitinophagaceae bacterium]|nr:PorT family protein [Chitinophagaceae bacterium]